MDNHVIEESVAKSTAKKASKSKPASPSAKKSSPVRKLARTVAPIKPPPARGRAKAELRDKPVKVASGNGAKLPSSSGTAPVGKPGKNQAGLKSKELEIFRDLLLAKRRELLGDVHSMEEEALRTTSDSNLSNLPIHMADMGTDNYEQEFTLGLVEKDRQLLREINIALTKIRDGTFGICEGTGKAITKARLEAKPWAKYSIEYTRRLEKGLIRP